MSYADFLKAIGCEPVTTYWNSFSIADRYGEDDIKYTFEQAFKECKSNYRELTELVMVLKYKKLQHGEIPHHTKLERLYTTLLSKAVKYAKETLKREELKYFCEVTD